MFVQSDRSAGGSKLQSVKRVLIDSTYPRTVANRELWLSISCSMKHVMTGWYPGSLPQGSWMQCFFTKFRYTACLNLVVSISESVLSRDNFLSTIFPRAERLACDSAVEGIASFQLPVLLLKVGIIVGIVRGGWFGFGWGEFLEPRILSAILFSTVLIHLALIPTCEPIKSPQKNLAKARPILDFLLACKVQFNVLLLSVTHSLFWMKKRAARRNNSLL